ncbi:MAG: 5-bromo-4-chloroindolyl phosphate hydrolysis family protein [Lachnospiraceae bacterium]|nr:5-bromo-4-chloroindolyl phosphate hydrolysis family protein [Lachnospiraceae bacterium]
MSIYDDIFGGIDQALDIVDEAISTGNFNNMSERIRDAVEPLDQKRSTGNRWRDEGGKAGGKSSYNRGRMDNRGNAFQGTFQSGRGGYSRQGSYGGQRAYDRRGSYNSQQSGQPGYRQPVQFRQPQQDPLTGETPFFKKVGSTFGSRAMFIIGILGAGFNGIISAMMVAATLAETFGGGGDLTGGVVASVLFLSLTAVFAMVANYGKKGREVVEHYKLYRKILSVNGYANIADIAKVTDIPEDKVRKELKSMTRAGMFKQGHFDDRETCFIASDEMYQLYRRAEDNSKRLREEAEKERREQGYVSAELKEVLDKGSGYVKLIREVNDDIPGREVSDKLEKMEKIVTKIFETVRENPEQADKLSMFMDYYLPTTAKLIIAYRDMDRKEVQGENIMSAKQEIENTLDMINEAFEKLFDSMFKEQSLDVQTDIDVMRTMMKQQGLAPNELDLLRRREAAQNAREAGADMWGGSAPAFPEIEPSVSVQETQPQTAAGERPMTAAERRRAEAEAVKAAEASLKSGGTTTAGGFAEQTSPILEWGGKAVTEEE